jgi:hypothetical protein
MLKNCKQIQQRFTRIKDYKFQKECQFLYIRLHLFTFRYYSHIDAKNDKTSTIMKKTYSLSISTFIAFLFVLVINQQSLAQFRSSEPSEYRNTGSILKVEQKQPVGGLSNFFNMKMSHSYEASFMSMGGYNANVNMYTNTMTFDFSPKFSGRLDLALAHSPFGGSMPGMQTNGANFIIRNAELNYKFSENTFIRFSYQESPYSGFGMFNPTLGNSFRNDFRPGW